MIRKNTINQKPNKPKLPKIMDQGNKKATSKSKIINKIPTT